MEKELTDGEKYSCCENYRDVNQQKLYIAERRSCELADEFTKLEVQIAIILFGLVGLFSNMLTETSITLMNNLFKIAYASIFYFLIASLILGLIHIKLRESFWDGHMRIRASRFTKWDLAVKRKVTYENAMSFHEGTANGNMEIISKSPDWTWVFQSIFLACAIFILLTLLVIYIF